MKCINCGEELDVTKISFTDTNIPPKPNVVCKCGSKVYIDFNNYFKQAEVKKTESPFKESLIFDMLTDVQKQIEALEHSKNLKTLTEYGKGTLDTFYMIKSKLLNLYQKKG